MKHYFYILIVGLILNLLACKPDSRDGKKATPQTTGQEKSEDTGFGDKKDVYYRFPSAREMLTYIKTDKLSYKPGITNPTTHLSNYHSTRSKTLNLGIYLTDLSYIVLFDKTQNIDKYFNAIFNLTNDLRIKIPEEEKLVERVSQNMYNSDSLISIADNYYDKIIDHLLSTGQEKVLAVISTGSYVEGLYISMNLIGDFQDNKTTVERIVAQRHAFTNLAHYAKTFEADLNTRYSLSYLNDINAFFDGLPVMENQTKVKRSKENTLIIEGGEKTEITAAQFRELKEKVTSIRNEIVNNKRDKK